MATRKKPAAQDASVAPVQSKQAKKDAAEVRDIQIDVHHDNVTNVPDAPVAQLETDRPGRSSKNRVVTFENIGGAIILSIDGKAEVELDREQFHGLQRHVSSIAASL